MAKRICYGKIFMASEHFNKRRIYSSQNLRTHQRENLFYPPRKHSIRTYCQNRQFGKIYLSETFNTTLLERRIRSFMVHGSFSPYCAHGRNFVVSCYQRRGTPRAECHRHVRVHSFYWLSPQLSYG